MKATPAPHRPARIPVQVYQGLENNDFRVRSPVGMPKKEWQERLKKALGSRSGAFVDASLHRLLAAYKLPGQGSPTSVGISAALALIESLEPPQNEIQAALAVDIACLHAAVGNVLSRLFSHSLESRTVVASNAAAKLERALNSAVDTFYRVKRGNTQTIRVEKVVIQSGAQAVVGQVVGR